MNPMDDDRDLEALLRMSPAAMPDDDGALFVDAVMRRVAAEAQRPTVAASVALERLRVRAARERQSARWSRLGTCAGAVLAAAAWWGLGAASPELSAAQLLALVAGLALAAWLLVQPADDAQR